MGWGDIAKEAMERTMKVAVEGIGRINLFPSTPVEYPRPLRASTSPERRHHGHS